MKDLSSKAPTLKGKEALDLWRRGREAWNSWVDQHSGWNVDFSGIDFSFEEDDFGLKYFVGYQFGDGDKIFHRATFGGGTDFSRSNFGRGKLIFSEARFGGGVLFNKATFENEKVDFSKAKFGKGKVDFSGARFADGKVTFSESTFNGEVAFYGATFDKVELMFSHATFEQGNLNFSSTTFENAKLDFGGSTFDDGSLLFTEATTFGNGNTNFYGATFKNGDVNFDGAILGDGNINFRQAKIRELHFTPKAIGSSRIQAEQLSIKGRTIFVLPPSAAKLKSLNVHSASFEGPLTLRGDLSIIPDIRATRYSHQVDLSDLNVKLPRISPKLGWPPKLSRLAKDPKDAARLRRLKEIAETNKDHQAALRFSADENRAKRWIETSWFGSVLDMAFSAFSDYGQNILRPFVALIVLTAASMGLYRTLATETSADGWTGWAQGAVLSASNSLPFLPQSRDLREDALTALYGTDPGLCVDILMITQGVLSFVFLFLIGLGLRNRFRL
ncbi:pentapeptide repeat-containing protein [Thalassospira permensis]|uniref:Pentapeptide repeat-containing protein n=1 Tax=Thalassospira permensis NBRC 106175 TaxID=1353532 RepID=A0ABR4TUF7_9PROT|nr:pentapeptide repeat-containing protein [Thalassospira permensis]KEO58657.1 hypothetical protein SMB34_12985 [Thalassospira permensis NBRC 106175]